MKASFVIACTTPAQLPPSDLLELAVAGRSNCGKSTLINALARRQKLARTSSTPGRTRQLVFFRLHPANHEPFHLVDLPGYGYARVSKQERRAWDRLVTAYIEDRSQLAGLLLLNDIRRTPATEERQLLTWCRQRGLQVLLALTKSDKLPKNKRFAAAEATRRALGLERRPLLVSSRDAASIDALRDRVLAMLPPSNADAPADPPRGG